MSRFSLVVPLYPNKRSPVEFSFSAGRLETSQVTLWVVPVSAKAV